jgi:hypothetical protein
MNWNPFKIPTAEELAEQALEAAKREMLHHEASTNYHKKMLEHYAETYKSITERLKTF